MKEQLMQLMRAEDAVNRHGLARAIGTSGNNIAFMVAFNEARNALVSEGIDFRPIRKRAGHYTRSTPLDTLRRVGNDRKAAVRKLNRMKDKAHSIKESDLPVEYRQSAERAKQKATEMVAQAIVSTYRRNFDPKPEKRAPNPRHAPKDIEKLIAAEVRKAVTNIKNATTTKEEDAHV